MRQQRRLAKSLSRTQKGSLNRKDAAAKLARHHYHVANVRRHFLHQASGALVKTDDRLVIEDLNVSGMVTNRRLARAISDAGWGEFARQLGYKQAWRGGELIMADRWSVEQALPTMRCHSWRLETRRPTIQLRMRTFCGPRLQRRGKSGPLGPDSP